MLRLKKTWVSPFQSRGVTMSGPIGDDYRVLQIHPTLRCNLKCPHCYSSSSPQEAGELSLDLLRQTLSEASAEGYNAVGVSGGEPLMFRSLYPVLDLSLIHISEP